MSDVFKVQLFMKNIPKLLFLKRYIVTVYGLQLLVHG